MTAPIVQNKRVDNFFASYLHSNIPKNHVQNPPNYFLYGTSKRTEFFINSIKEGIVDEQGNVTKEWRSFFLHPLSEESINELYDDLFDSFDLVIDHHAIKISYGKIIKEFLCSDESDLKKLNIELPYVHYIGGMVYYTLLFQEKNYITNILSKINKKLLESFSEELLRGSQIPPPDKDLKIRLFDPNFSEEMQGLQKCDFLKVLNIIFKLVSTHLFSDPYFQNFSQEELINKIHTQALINPNIFLDLGMTRFLMIFFKGTKYHVTLPNVQYQPCVFDLDGLYFSIKDLILKGKKSVVYPQCHLEEQSGLQVIFHHLLGLIKATNPEKLDYKAWFRMMSWISKGLSSGQAGLEQLLWEKMDKELMSSPRKGFSKFNQELGDWLWDHHPSDAFATFSLLFDQLSFLKDRISCEKIEALLEHFQKLPAPKEEENPPLLLTTLSSLASQKKCVGLHAFNEIAHLMMDSECVSFEVLYAFLDLCFFFYHSRCIKKKSTLVIDIEHHEFTYPVTKCNVFREGYHYSLQIKINPNHSLQILLKAKKEHQHWSRFENALFPFLIDFCSFDLFQPMSEEFKQKLDALDIDYAKFQELLHLAATSDSLLLNYLNILLDSKSHHFLIEKEIQQQLIVSVQQKKAVSEIKEEMISEFFSRNDSSIIDKGYQLWITLCLKPISKNFLRFSLGLIQRILEIQPLIAEKMVADLKVNKAFVHSTEEDCNLVSNLCLKIKSIVDKNKEKLILYENLRLRIADMMVIMISQTEDCSQFDRHISNCYLWLIQQLALQKNYKYVGKMVQVGIEKKLFIEKLLIPIYKKISEKSSSEVYQFWSHILSESLYLESLFPSLIQVAKNLTENTEFFHCLEAIERINAPKHLIDELRLESYHRQLKTDKIFEIIKLRKMNFSFFL